MVFLSCWRIGILKFLNIPSFNVKTRDIKLVPNQIPKNIQAHVIGHERINHLARSMNLMNFIFELILSTEANQVVHISYITIIYFTKTNAGGHGANKDGTLNEKIQKIISEKENCLMETCQNDLFLWTKREIIEK